MNQPEMILTKWQQGDKGEGRFCMTKIFIAMLQAKNFEVDRDKISATKSSVNNVAIVV